MKLQEFLKEHEIIPVENKMTFTGIPDKGYKNRDSLWNLEDYKVWKVSGSMIWLVKKMHP